MIAALYVQTGGVYYGLDDVDPWDEARDARLYAGPWPVVAHPPCNRWSRLATFRRQRDGQDGGCFEAALRAVRAFGGVLEHPAHTLAWRTFGLAYPTPGGWTRSLLDDGWTCQVDQGLYGHEARKQTWLYYIGDAPPELLWGDGGRRGEVVKDMNRLPGQDRSSKRSATPLAFRDVLLAMARTASPAVLAGKPETRQ